MRTESALHSVSVTGVVIRADGRVLMTQRADDGRWVPPGGILELHETPQQGVVREVREETGIDIRPEQLTGVYKNMLLGVVSLAFRCTPLTDHPHTSTEVQAVAWLTTQEAIAAAPQARAIRIRDALRPDGPFVRAHDGTSLLPA